MFFDTRYQTLKAEKGESPKSKSWEFFLVAQYIVLSHRAKFQVIINFFRVIAISYELKSQSLKNFKFWGKLILRSSYLI